MYLNHKDKVNNKRRYLIKIEGIVQGVGFRPLVYNKAKEFHLKGYVKNKGSMVEIDLEGHKENIKNFLLEVVKNPPIMSKIENLKCKFLKPINYMDFIIKESSSEKNAANFISPDIALCKNCIKELNLSTNKRYEHPFINCTDCGPRYSIIKSLPYDRESTTMKNFTMCNSCRQEYDIPDNRRFHAEPNCCNLCGPSLILLNNKKQVICTNKAKEYINNGDYNKKKIYNNYINLANLSYKKQPIYTAVELIKKGYIVAVKGIGGFHLVCNGKNKKAIENLRIRKKRPHKPLAIMCKDLKIVKELCYVSKSEEQILKGNKKPILILKKKSTNILPDNIAPLNKYIGVMLPYSPLHYLLFKEGLDVIIATSGNISGIPMEYKNCEAIENLKTVADYFLIHNRDIHTPVDDSVVKVINNKESLIRIGRGYAPYTLNIESKNELLAKGAEEKNTFCLSQKGYIYISQYIGDLKNLDCYSRHLNTIKHLKALLDINPKIAVEDLHPNFNTNCENKSYNKTIKVQHHHAHMVSCMVEHSLFDRVIAVIFDGTGFGKDNSIWGGEFLVGDRTYFERVGHLKKVKIQGGDKSIKEPWRCALSYLHSINYKNSSIIKNIEEEKIEIVKKALFNNINCYTSSSMGRFFDAVASLVGIRNIISYDGQAPIELENIIDESVSLYYDYSINKIDNVLQIDYKNILLGIITDLEENKDLTTISSKFHNTVINFTCDLVCKIKKSYKLKYKLDKVVLSGGVFQNNYLLKGIYNKLKDNGFKVFFNEKVPINDEGISLGQLAIGDSIIERERRNVHCNTRENYKY
ncbi:carbamoyltransferase HypF [Clostridium botulinum]|nr:carbamoyltransferase HypF [Clostridium botulinum]EKO2041775.1 carbamoyltransferase HypF [Clostridium botulinum]